MQYTSGSSSTIMLIDLWTICIAQNTKGHSIKYHWTSLVYFMFISVCALCYQLSRHNSFCLPIISKNIAGNILLQCQKQLISQSLTNTNICTQLNVMLYITLNPPACFSDKSPVSTKGYAIFIQQSHM
jgi:hypothetical protein